MSHFVCLAEIGEREVISIVCVLEKINWSEFGIGEDIQKDLLSLNVIDKSVNESVEVKMSLKSRKILEGRLSPGIILYLDQANVILENGKHVIYADISSSFTKVWGFNPTSEDFQVIFSSQLTAKYGEVTMGIETARNINEIRKFLNESQELSHLLLPGSSRILCVASIDDTQNMSQVNDPDITLDEMFGIKEETDEVDVTTVNDREEVAILQEQINVDVQSTPIKSSQQSNIEHIFPQPQQENNENRSPETWVMEDDDEDVIEVQATSRKPQLTVPVQYTTLRQTQSFRYYNVACQIVAIYDRNYSNSVLRVTDGTVVRRALIKVPNLESSSHINLDINNRFHDRCYDIDVFDEYAEQVKLFKPGDFITIVNVHTYVNKSSGEILTLHKNGDRYNRGIYELKIDSNVGRALQKQLANGENEARRTMPSTPRPIFSQQV